MLLFHSLTVVLMLPILTTLVDADWLADGVIIPGYVTMPISFAINYSKDHYFSVEKKMTLFSNRP